MQTANEFQAETRAKNVQLDSIQEKKRFDNQKVRNDRCFVSLAQVAAILQRKAASEAAAKWFSYVSTERPRQQRQSQRRYTHNQYVPKPVSPCRSDRCL